MPELPELETLTAFVRSKVVGCTVAEVQVSALAAVKTADPPISTLTGRQIIDVGRLGKWLLFRTEGERPLILAVHFSRAGWLRWRDDPPAIPARIGAKQLAARFVFTDSDGLIRGAMDFTEAGTRKSLAVHLVTDLASIPAVAELGPDPLQADFDAAILAERLSRQQGRWLKSFLRDQSVVAGIGNAYSDEILHRARLSPTTRANSLDEAEVLALYSAIRDVLNEALDRLAQLDLAKLKDGKRAGLVIHGHTGAPCPVCGDVIREVSSSDSSFQYCASCQTNGQVLSDRRMSRLLK